MNALRGICRAILYGDGGGGGASRPPPPTPSDADCEEGQSASTRYGDGDAALAAFAAVDAQAVACRKYLERHPGDRVARLDPWWHYTRFGGGAETHLSGISVRQANGGVGGNAGNGGER